MELDWTTFILEIINFLVLVWILRRFLYRPVMKVVAERRAVIAKGLDDAKAAQDQAAALKAQYENRLQDWQQERETARAKLHDEIAAERQKLLAQLQDELSERRRKEQVLAGRREEALMREARRQASELSGRFAAKLLTRLAGPAVQDRLLTMLLEDLDKLSPDQRQQLADARPGAAAVQVISAFPLDDQQQSTLAAALRKILGDQLDFEFRENPALQAGLSVHVGAQRLQASLQEELRFFSDSLRHEP